jgi:hypothetical protein
MRLTSTRNMGGESLVLGWTIGAISIVGDDGWI